MLYVLFYLWCENLNVVLTESTLVLTYKNMFHPILLKGGGEGHLPTEEDLQKNGWGRLGENSLQCRIY